VVPTTSNEAEVRRARASLAELFGSDTDVKDVVATERLAAALLAMGQVPDMAPGLAEAALETLEKAGDARAAGLLAAMVVLARPPLAGVAGAALERLRLAGVRSLVEGEVGTLVVEEARRFELGPGEVLAAVMRRPGASEVQAAMVIVEHEQTGGAAVGGSLSPPVLPHLVEGTFREMAAVEGGRASPLSTSGLTSALRDAFARSADIGVAVSFDLGATVPVLARALTGDAAAFAPVMVDGGHDLALDPEDDDEFEAVSEELAEHLFEVAEGDPVLERSGLFVAGSMLDYKWRYGNRRLGSWTTADLDDYLLDHFPRKVSANHEIVADTPACAVAFLTMLDDHDALDGEPLEVLGAHVGAIAEQFRRAASDRRRWGPAKSTMMAMLDEGVDPRDEDAVAAWLSAARGRTGLPGAAPSQWATAGLRPDDGPHHGGRTSSAARAKQRKSARAARRRNRA
jgi:hypothetical protein